MNAQGHKCLFVTHKNRELNDENHTCLVPSLHKQKNTYPFDFWNIPVPETANQITTGEYQRIHLHVVVLLQRLYAKPREKI
jgi:hypothetical protein